LGPNKINKDNKMIKQGKWKKCWFENWKKSQKIHRSLTFFGTQLFEKVSKNNNQTKQEINWVQRRHHPKKALSTLLTTSTFNFWTII